MTRKILFIFILGILLAACQGGDTETAAVFTATVIPSDTPIPSSTHQPTSTIELITTVEPTIAAESATIEAPRLFSTEDPNKHNLVENGSFDTGTSGWDRPYGKLAHTKSEYHNAPGAARLTTTKSTTSLDFNGSIGQCIDLSDLMDAWSEAGGKRVLTIEAYVKMNAGIARVVLNGIYSDDAHCGTGHVGDPGTSTIAGKQTWISLSTTIEIPADAQSLHIYFWATGTDDSAFAYIDDVMVYSPPSESLLLSSTPTPTASAIQTTPTPTTGLQGAAKEIDTYLNGLVEQGSFTGAVLVGQDDQVLLNTGYGFSHRAENIPNTSQTKFRICSLTKQFTAMGILILGNQGKLSVDDRICKYLAECPTAWGAITVHHLLTHTSGIPDFTDLPDYESTKSRPSSPLQTIARFIDKPLEFTAGEEWSYSNSGYIILGSIIEQVSGQGYEDFIQENIFTPLKMDDSGYDHNLDTIATGYTGIGDPWHEADYIDMSIPYAAGALYSTVEDMYRWDQALYTERLISQALLDEMFTPYASSPIGGYGYGWIISVKHDRQVIRHGGGGDGFIALIERYPHDRVTLIILSNRETTDIGMIADTLAEMIFGE